MGLVVILSLILELILVLINRGWWPMDYFFYRQESTEFFIRQISTAYEPGTQPPVPQPASKIIHDREFAACPTLPLNY